MKKETKHACVYLGTKTKRLIKNFAEDNEISHSAVIKLAVNEFFRTRGIKQ